MMKPFRRKAVVAVTGTVIALALGAGPAAAQTSAEAETHFKAGLMHLQEGRTDLALEEFKKAVKADPKNPYAYKGLGEAYARKLKFDDAIAALEKSLELNPYYVDVRNDLGSVLVLAGKREEGKKQFLTAFGDPTNPTPEISARNLGQVHLDEKNYPEAANWFKTAVSRNKNFTDPYLGLAEALLAMGRTEEAVTQIEAGLKEVPEAPDLLVGLGELYSKAGRFIDARKMLEAAVRKDPAGVSGQRAAALLKSLPK